MTTLAVPIESATSGEVYRLLRSRPGGLTATEVEERAARHGPNRLEDEGARRLLPRLVGQFTHLMAVLLWVAGLLALFAGLPELAGAVWVVNLVNGLFSFWQEHRAERAVAALRELLPATVRVMRDGRECTVVADALVPGDVLQLAEGARISADARLVEAHELRVDQSTLTGESQPVRRTARPLPAAPRPATDRLNVVFAGTLVTSGRGKAVVTATGMDTEFGAVAALTGAMTREQSPLQRELVTLTRIVGVIAVSLGALFFVLAQLLTDMTLEHGLVFGLGMIVAFVPEGLLPTVSLALALGTQRMARRQALVKRLSSVEALGSTTVICTDKTGTLTANQMTVRAIHLIGADYEVTGVGYAPEGRFVQAGHPVSEPHDDLRELLWAGAAANDARLEEPDDPADAWSVIGDPTEAALLVAARKGGLPPPAPDRSGRLAEWPFDAARKLMSTLDRTEDGAAICVKGAPSEVFRRCSHVRMAGRDAPFDGALATEMSDANDRFSRDALRVLAVAVRHLGPGEPPPRTAEEAESDLVLLGLIAMLDPPRPAVAHAVETCHRAGIRILMMTGDYGLTAEGIARRIGIVGPDEPVRIVNGDEIDPLDDETLTALVGEPVLFARATPRHKLRVVEALQRRGEIVAVTGDGVNDAPALKRADIGIAMGASGTDVAREAADMVLLDDDFSSIVAAVEEGRAVYANIRKFTGYIFTSNTPEAVPFILFGLSGGRIPIALDVMHILSVDLGTDLVPALALGGEPAEPGIMDRPPRRRDEHLVTPGLLRRSYLWLGPLQAAAVMLAFYLVYWAAGFEGWLDLPSTGAVHAAASAAALAMVTTTQIGNLLAHRTERLSIRHVGWRSNRLIWVGIASELALIAAIVYAPPLQAIVGTAAFPAWTWFVLFATSPLLLVADELRKARQRSRPHQEVRT